MRIGIATTTRFHMFDLARQMRRLGESVQLFTALPSLSIEPDLRSVAHTRSSRLLMSRAAARVPLLWNLREWDNAMISDIGRWNARVAHRMQLDVFDALDGTGLEAGAAVQKRGGVWFCNRGSAHILTQQELVVTEHERWSQPVPPSSFNPWLVDRWLAEYACADGIIVPSHFAKRSFLERKFDPESVHVCPYGVDLSLFIPQPKKDDRFRILFAGTACVRKGIGYLFEALRPLIQSRAVELWLVGSTTPDGKAILDRNADLFVHHGIQARSRLSWFYSQASALILPSVEEGLALVQAQAMACGLPVIATPNTGAEDLFTDGVEGFIVRPRDPAAIRDRVERLLDDPALLARMKSAALERVQSFGGWAKYGETCRQVYRRVLQRRGMSETTASV